MKTKFIIFLVLHSSGGIPRKMKGRISDAPLVGCGGYANEYGAATSSGFGEVLIKMTLARDVVYNIESGKSAMVKFYYLFTHAY